MPIVHASIVPHSPALLPLVGKEHRELLTRTIAGLSAVNESLKTCKPDTIVVLAPHAASHDGTHLSLHVPERYSARFEQFGDMATRDEYSPDIVLGTALKQAFLDAHIEAAYSSEKQLEYSAGVPLHLVTAGVAAKIIVLHPGESESLAANSAVGKILARALQATPKRIAILASGDLSHCLTESAPGGYKPHALQFDKEILSVLKAQRHQKIVKTDTALAKSFGVCGLEVFTILLHLLHTTTYSQKFHSYEYPLGVGHVVMEFLF